MSDITTTQTNNQIQLQKSFEKFESQLNPANANILKATIAWSSLSALNGFLYGRSICNYSSLDFKDQIYKHVVQIVAPAGIVAGSFVASSIISARTIRLVNQVIASELKALGFKRTLHIPEFFGAGVGIAIAHGAAEAFKNMNECYLANPWYTGIPTTSDYALGYPSLGFATAIVLKLIADRILVKIESNDEKNESK